MYLGPFLCRILRPYCGLREDGCTVHESDSYEEVCSSGDEETVEGIYGKCNYYRKFVKDYCKYSM